MRYPALCLPFFVLFSVSKTEAAFTYHEQITFNDVGVKARPNERGIKEVVPKQFLARYEKWKNELLATDYGREMWKKYEDNADFLLTIKVSAGRKSGAGTDDFEWDADGKLVAATITLGKDLDKGFPDPVYYPVMNSLASQREIHSMTGDLLASTKIVHEIGHVTFTAQANSQIFQQQNRLIENYYRIFLNNGFNTRDPRLVMLENELGARPLDIWEDREYWSEVNALRYLVERIDRESFYCSVLNKIRSNVVEYANRYQARFDLATIVHRPTCGS
jgi:hypothetical protein